MSQMVVNERANTSYWTNEGNCYETAIVLNDKDGWFAFRPLPAFCCLCGSRLAKVVECEDAYLFCPNNVDPMSEVGPRACRLPVLTVYGGSSD